MMHAHNNQPPTANPQDDDDDAPVPVCVWTSTLQRTIRTARHLPFPKVGYTGLFITARPFLPCPTTTCILKRTTPFLHPSKPLPTT
jgi:hypothetical protein